MSNKPHPPRFPPGALAVPGGGCFGGADDGVDWADTDVVIGGDARARDLPLRTVLDAEKDDERPAAAERCNVERFALTEEPFWSTGEGILGPLG